MTNKFGRLPQVYDPRVPHLSGLISGKASLPVIPDSVDYSTKLALPVGNMLNNRLQDCICAAYYHARQVWTSMTAIEVTELDSNVQLLYQKSCGYSPGNSATDRGGIIQNVLAYLVKYGAPVGHMGSVDKLWGYVQTDCRNLDDIRRMVYDCGVCFVGINIPKALNTETPPAIWDYDKKADNTIIERHAFIIVGYRPGFFKIVSWGGIYQVTEAFLIQFIREAYGLTDSTWFNATGKSILGMLPHDLWTLMLSIRV